MRVTGSSAGVFDPSESASLKLGADRNVGVLSYVADGSTRSSTTFFFFLTFYSFFLQQYSYLFRTTAVPTPALEPLFF